MFVTSISFRMGPLNRLKNGHTPSFKSIECGILAQSAHVWFSQPSFQNPSMHHVTHCNRMQHTTIHCNTLQHTATHMNQSCRTYGRIWTNSSRLSAMSYVTHCNTLQHTATHCNTLQHRATHYTNARAWVVSHTWWNVWPTWSQIIPRLSALRHVTHRKTLQDTARHCNILQDIAVHCNPCRWVLSHIWQNVWPTLPQLSAMSHVTHCITHGVSNKSHHTLQHTATHCNTLHHCTTLLTWESNFLTSIPPPP